MKKILSLLLVISMLFSVAVICVNAENSDTTQPAEISDAFLSAVQKHYKDYSIEKDDITILKWLNLQDHMDFVQFELKGYSYSDEVYEIGFGNYILTESGPEPVMFMLDRILDMDYVSVHGMLSTRYLETMRDSGLFDIRESKIQLDLLNAMKESEDDDYIKVLFFVEGSNKTVSDFGNVFEDLDASIEKLYAHLESLHQKLVSEVLKDVDHIDIKHRGGYSLIALKKSDIEKVAENDFVLSMRYVSDIHMRYIETYDSLSGYLYKEEMTQPDDDGTPQYTLIYARSISCREASAGFRIGDVVMNTESQYNGFDYKYGIYDYKEDKIYDMFELKHSYEKYDNLLENLVLYADACRVGDTDRDGKVTVMDATKVQRILSLLDRPMPYEYYSSKDGSEYGCVSDFDNDGNMTVMDATAIQKYVAKI